MSITIQTQVQTPPPVTKDGTTNTGQVPTTGSGISGTTGTSGPTGIPPQTGQTQTGQTQTGTLTQTSGTRSGNTMETKNRVSDAQTQGMEKAYELLNKLIKSLRDPDQLAALLIEMNDLQRQNALDQRLSSRDIAKSQLEGQAAEMMQAAVKEMAAAAVAVAMAVVTFAVSFAGTLKMGGEIKEGAQAGSKSASISEKVSAMKDDFQKHMNNMSPEMAKKMEMKIASIEKSAAKLDLASNIGFRNSDQTNLVTQALSTLLRGVSEAMEGTLRGFAKMDDAQGQILAANAEDTKADADQIKSYMDAVDDLLKSALDFIQKLNDAEVEMMASASRL